MSKQDRLRDETVVALARVVDKPYTVASAVLPVLRRHLDDARKQDHAAIETQIAEHVATRAQAVREQVAEEIAAAIEAHAEGYGDPADNAYEYARIAREHVKED